MILVVSWSERTRFVRRKVEGRFADGTAIRDALHLGRIVGRRKTCLPSQRGSTRKHKDWQVIAMTSLMRLQWMLRWAKGADARMSCDALKFAQAL